MKLILGLPALVIGTSAALAGEIASPPKTGIDPNFDIVRAAVSSAEGKLTFDILVSGQAGATRPAATAAMLGSGVHAYVWPTSLDSAAVGFDAQQGIVALAVTAHPDFDDTPNYDENGDGDAANDGNEWHSHWVVLNKDAACAAGLKVKDVSPGTKVTMPASAPGVPLFLDSPDFRPQLAGAAITVAVAAPEGAADMKFDGVAAGLRVNQKMEAPLLCVTDVFKVASGDLSLPGTVTVK